MSNQMIDIIRYATLAPSGHNTQPWKFSIKDNIICIFPDFTRRLPIADPDDRELYISLGCALENLTVAAHHVGFEVDVEYFPSSEPKDCILIRLRNASPDMNELLFKAIPERQCTRNEYHGQSIPSPDLKKLEYTPKEPGVNSILFTDTRQIEPLIEYVREGNNIQLADDAFLDELKSWIRFSDGEALEKGDGLSSRSTGNPSVPRWLGKFFMNLFLSGESQGKTDEKMIRSSSGLILFVSDRNDRKAWIEVGQTYERWALTSTSLNIKSAFLNQPTEVPKLRAQLQQHLNLGSAQPQLLVRFGYSEPMPRSPRRPVEQVIL